MQQENKKENKVGFPYQDLVLHYAFLPQPPFSLSMFLPFLQLSFSPFQNPNI